MPFRSLIIENLGVLGDLAVNLSYDFRDYILPSNHC